MPAADNSNHSGGAVGPNVMPDDGVGRCEIVACQTESISKVAEKRSSHEFILFSTIPENPQSGTNGVFQKAIALRIAFRKEVACSERPYILSLPALGTLRDVELHGLALLQALETARLDCREVHKNIFATLAADETIALGVVEPLHCSLFCHIDTVVPFH